MDNTTCIIPNQNDPYVSGWVKKYKYSMGANCFRTQVVQQTRLTKCTNIKYFITGCFWQHA